MHEGMHCRCQPRYAEAVDATVVRDSQLRKLAERKKMLKSISLSWVGNDNLLIFSLSVLLIMSFIVTSLFNLGNGDSGKIHVDWCPWAGRALPNKNPKDQFCWFQPFGGQVDQFRRFKSVGHGDRNPASPKTRSNSAGSNHQFKEVSVTLSLCRKRLNHQLHSFT